MNIEADAVYRLGNAVALVTYVDGYTVLWRSFDPKTRRFPSRGHQSTPLWYFEKHADRLKVNATVEEVLRAAEDTGCVATVEQEDGK